LAKVPAESPSAAAETYDALVKLGEPAVLELCGKLVPTGAGDDLNARLALNGLTKRVSTAADDAARALVSNAYVKALAAAGDTEVKAFLVRQLEAVGKAEAVPALAALLTDPDLARPVAQALEANASPEAVAALTAALPKAEGLARIAVIDALGQRQAAGAAEIILAFVENEDAALRNAALAALANIGAPGAKDPLAAAVAAAQGYDKTKLTSWYLLFAARRAEAGDIAACEIVCGELMVPDAPANVQCAALSTLVSAKGAGAMKDLLAAMDSESAEIRGAALKLADAIPDERAARQWLQCMQKAQPVVRAEILGMLGRRGDPYVKDAVLASLGHSDLAVRLAAADASVRLAGAGAAPAILGALEKATEDSEIAALKGALQRLSGETNGLLADALTQVPPAGKVALIQILAARSAAPHLFAVIGQLQDPEERVRVAAFRALANLATPEDLSGLVGFLLRHAQTGAERDALRQTAVQLANTLPEKEDRAKAMLAAYPLAGDVEKACILTMLSGVGGSAALDHVSRETQNEAAALKNAAVGALAAWPDADATDALLAIVKTATAPEHQQQAMGGYLRLVRTGRLSTTKKLEHCQTAMDAAQRVEEKKAVLSNLGGLRNGNVLAYVEGFLADETLKTAAAHAIVHITCPKDDKDKGMKEPEAGAALRKALGAIAEPPLKKRAEDHLAAAFPESEFVSLFNGADLTGWVGDTEGYVVEAGLMVCKPGGNLYTEKAYKDFVYRFEFKLTPGANNGLGVRCPMGGGARNGYELQILENTAEKYKDLQPWQYHGSIYGLVPSKRGFQKPVGEWNQQEVTIIGRQFKVVLNGETIVDANVDEALAAPPDGKEHKNTNLEEGHIGFLGHGDVLYFRNMAIKEL
ncbi:MAG: DUF1080 domain-containing protein, partial [Bradyrhizobium sp.]|nr:DUF1080 domain-containing protein [Bradyrhizobium sp.]